jgi:hypothetical protein
VNDEHRTARRLRLRLGEDADQLSLRPGEPDLLTAARIGRGRRGLSTSVVVVIVAARRDKRDRGRSAHAQQAEPTKRLAPRQDAVGTVERDLLDQVTTKRDRPRLEPPRGQAARISVPSPR